MKLVVAVVLLCVGCLCGARQNNLYKNKRIIKVRVPPRPYPAFYNSPKGYSRPGGSPIRFKEYHSKYPEFSRPNHPPFYNSYNSFGNAYVKHQSRPPPQGLPGFGGSFSGPGFGHSFKGFSKEVHQKFPISYGSSYPHKGPFSSFKFPSVKDEIRIAHTQTFSAPVASVQTPTASPLTVSHSSSSSSSSSGSSSSYSTGQQPTSYYVSTPHAHVQSSDDNRGPIREIPAPNLGPKPSDSLHGEEYATYGKGPSIDVTNLVTDSGAQQLSFPATEYYSAFGQPQHYEIITDNGLSTVGVYDSGYYKDSQIGAFADGAAHGSSVSDVAVVSTSAPSASYKSNQINVTPVPSPSTGYEVTEEQQTGSGGSGADSDSSKFYYAPDPDPSLPVHKVPPTKEVLADESLAETYVPHVTQNFQILEGGTVAAPLTTLSPQELFHLMHGFPRQIPVVGEPIVTIVGHQQPAGVYLQSNYQYAQVGGNNEQYPTQTTASDVQYQQSGSTQQDYVAQQQYGATYSQTSQDASNYNSQGSSSYEYEPEASESRKQGSIMKMDDESENSVENVEPQQENQIIIHFNKVPEVPFYTTLPNKKAAEALATLQAAGSIGSNYVDRIKETQEDTRVSIPESAAAAAVFLRGDQGPEAEDVDSEISDVELPQQELESEKEQTDDNASSVEIQKSIPLYETSYAASSLLDDGSTTDTRSTFSVTSTSTSQSTSTSVKSESFGKRIRPK